MTFKLIGFQLILLLLCLPGCFANAEKEAAGQNSTKKTEGQRDNAEKGELPVSPSLDRVGELSPENEKEPKADNPAKGPGSVREFFMLLPEKYFFIECCERDKKAYLEKYLTVEDAANGYLEAGGDGAQDGFKMALFKRPDKSYVIGFNTFGEAEDDYYFLEYKNKEWIDVSTREVPKYNRKTIYDFPRFGTKIEVFSKKILEQDGDFEISEKGEKLYNLIWENGKFRIEK
ncbi:MAG: hypothetical protein R2747_06460 [Pyrinomonadaceae bacterium]